jgi:23S rRNA (guanosine2251-2'-O)-methyltransferase
MGNDTNWIWGRRPVLAAIRAGRAIRVVLASTRQPAPVLTDIRREASVRRVPIGEQPLPDLERLTGSRHTQGAAAQVSAPDELSLDDVLADVGALSSAAFILVLDQVQDPHNLGALLRTAEAAGVDAVVLPDRRSAPLTGTVAKTSAGAVSFVQIARVNNLDRALRKLRDAGIWIVGLDGEGDRVL